MLRRALLPCLLLLLAGGPLRADDAHPLVRALQEGDATAIDRIAGLPGAQAEALVPQLLAVVEARPAGGSTLLPPAILAARALARLGVAGRQALREALESENPQAIVAASTAIEERASLWTPDERAPLVPALQKALRLETPLFFQRVHWHPWQPCYHDAPRAVAVALGSLGTVAAPAAPDLLALLDTNPRAPALAVFDALTHATPEAPGLVDLLVKLVVARRVSLGRDDLSWLEDWLRDRGVAALPALEAIFDTYANYGAPTATTVRLIAQCGHAADDVLTRLLAKAGTPHARQALVGAMAETGTVPAACVPLVAAWFREGFESASYRWTTAFLGVAGEAGEDAVLDVLGEKPWYAWEWGEVLSHATPGFTSRLSRRWWALHRGEVHADLFAYDGGSQPKTPARGGSGGGAFSDVGPDGALLTGLVASLGDVGGHLVVKRATPLFGGVRGRTHGKGGWGETTLAAPDGYAVAGLLVKWGDRVDGFALVFARVTEADLDPEDALLSPWVGGAAGAPLRLLGGDGTRVVGIHGRSGADLDAVGLIGSE